MKKAPIPDNEVGRLEAVHRLAILDTNPEPRFDILTREATIRFSTPISTISIIDANREWYKSCVGINQKEGGRDISFCGHTILGKGIFVVEDTLKDPRFSDNPMVTGAPFIRFYAGATLRDYKTDHVVGVFCIKDTKPRTFSMEETAALIDIAERAEKELNQPLQEKNSH